MEVQQHEEEPRLAKHKSSNNNALDFDPKLPTDSTALIKCETVNFVRGC